MIQSMTGYGKAVVTFKDKKINVEVKSLNSKALDLSARLAPIYREKEMEIRQLIAATLLKSKVDFALWAEKETGVEPTPINAKLVENYYHQIKAISAATGIPEPKDWFYTLLRMPDVETRTENEELTPEEWQAAQGAINEALNSLQAFRRQEGAALEKKFNEKIDNIEALLHSIKPLEKEPGAKDSRDHHQSWSRYPGHYNQNRLEQGSSTISRSSISVRKSSDWPTT